MHELNRILLVDGNVPLRLMLRSILEDRGYRVALSSGGAEAGCALREHQIELLIVDCGFRSTAGLELADYARTLSIPAILMSAELGSEEALAHGPHSYILKPFRMREFTDKVQAVLAGASAVERAVSRHRPSDVAACPSEVVLSDRQLSMPLRDLRCAALEHHLTRLPPESELVVRLALCADSPQCRNDRHFQERINALWSAVGDDPEIRTRVLLRVAAAGAEIRKTYAI